MSYYVHGTAALKEYVNDRNKKLQIEMEKQRIEALRRKKLRTRKQKALRLEVVFSILISFMVFGVIVYGYVEPTRLRNEVNQLEKDLHVVTGIRNDRIADVETIKASNDIIRTAQNVLGMNFATEENYVRIALPQSVENEMENKNILSHVLDFFGSFTLEAKK